MKIELLTLKIKPRHWVYQMSLLQINKDSALLDIYFGGEDIDIEFLFLFGVSISLEEIFIRFGSNYMKQFKF